MRNTISTTTIIPIELAEGFAAAGVIVLSTDNPARLGLDDDAMRAMRGLFGRDSFVSTSLGAGRLSMHEVPVFTYVFRKNDNAPAGAALVFVHSDDAAAADVREVVTSMRVMLGAGATIGVIVPFTQAEHLAAVLEEAGLQPRRYIVVNK